MNGLWWFLLVWGSVAGWVFCLVYALAPKRDELTGRPVRRPWWKSPVGWNLMVFTLAIASVLTFLTVAEVTGGMPEWVWVLHVLVFDLLLTHRLLLLLADHPHQVGHH